MFRIAIVIVLLLLLFIYLRNRKLLASAAGLRQKLLFSLKRNDAHFVHRLRLFSFSWAVVLFLLLALSGFLPVLLSGHSISGMVLIVHVLIAPFFLFAFTLWILSTVRQQTFTSRDWQIFQQGRKTFCTDRHLWGKLIFWLIFFLILLGVGAIIFSLFALFSAQTIGLLIDVHRYVMLLTFLIAGYAYFHYFSQDQKQNIREK